MDSYRSFSLSLQMAMGSNGSPFPAQGYGQAAATTVAGQQLANKAALANSLPPFPNELKGAGVNSVPNMVSSCQLNATLPHTQNIVRYELKASWRIWCDLL